MEIEEGVIRRGRRPRRITPSQISIILHMIRKPNSIIVFYSFKIIPSLKITLKHAYLHRCQVHLRQCTFRVVQLRKYSPNSRCRPLRCVLAVFSYNFAQFLPLKRVKCPSFFVFTPKTTQPRPQVFSVNGALTRRQPRPRGLLAFQCGGGRRADPGTQQKSRDRFVHGKRKFIQNGG